MKWHTNILRQQLPCIIRIGVIFLVGSKKRNGINKADPPSYSNETYLRVVKAGRCENWGLNSDR